MYSQDHLLLIFPRQGYSGGSGEPTSAGGGGGAGGDGR